MSKKNPIDLHIFPDDFFEDGEEYPGEEQMLQDIASALNDFAEFDRGERQLRVTEYTDEQNAATDTETSIIIENVPVAPRTRPESQNQKSASSR